MNANNSSLPARPTHRACSSRRFTRKTPEAIKRTSFNPHAKVSHIGSLAVVGGRFTRSGSVSIRNTMFWLTQHVR
jgi:hypothetical protein